MLLTAILLAHLQIDSNACPSSSSPSNSSPCFNASPRIFDIDFLTLTSWHLYPYTFLLVSFSLSSSAKVTRSCMTVNIKTLETICSCQINIRNESFFKWQIGLTGCQTRILGETIERLNIYIICNTKFGRTRIIAFWYKSQPFLRIALVLYISSCLL